VVADPAHDSRWTRNEGNDENYTQICSNKPVVWNHPLDLSFSTTSVSTWPHIFIEIWSQDEYGRNDIAGYGHLQVPSAPGYYEDIDAVIWRCWSV
jgi:B9 domain-containing protein 2